jgi:hypothetical protein
VFQPVASGGANHLWWQAEVNEEPAGLGALRFAHTAERAIEGEHAKVSDITCISKFVTK